MHEQPIGLIDALKRLLEERGTLTRAEARQLLTGIFEEDRPGNDLRIAALLGALSARGETPEELAGFVDAMRARVLAVPLPEAERARLVDTCGTGGDLSGTFNISTAAALVAAAAGACVAKHGNRAVTSRSGSADVLDALGVPVDLGPEAAAEALRRHRFAFLPAPGMQPAMKAVMPIRRALGVRTAFNILGPMTNPAGAVAQVIGVYSERIVAVAAETLALLNTRHAFVVHGALTESGEGPGMDEFSLSGRTTVAEVKNGVVRQSTVFPEDFGLPRAPAAALAGGDPTENAAILTRIFAGVPGPCRDVVVMNAGAVLVTAGLADDFASGARLAESTIDSGKVSALLQELSAS